MALSKKVHLARDLALPAAEFATQVTASLGMRGSGKTNGAAVIAEDLLEAGVQVVVLDYVGIWFSLRLQDDGKTASPYQIPVLGGRHGELPGLERGTAIVWSPVRQIYGAHAIRKRSTYDAGATPIHARAAVKTKPLDLASLEAVMGKAVEEAKANDPRALKGRIAELEKELKKKVPLVQPDAPKPEPLISDMDLKRIERLLEKLADGETTFLAKSREIFDRLTQAQQAVVSELGNLAMALKRGVRLPKDAATVRTYERTPAQVKKALAPAADRHFYPVAINSTSLSKCARAILGVLAQRDISNDSQISALSGYRKTSSGFANALSELRTQALIEGPKERREITQAGRAVIGHEVPPLPTGSGLLRYWTAKLGKCERALLEKIFDAGTIPRTDLSDQTGYSMTSSGFMNALSQLRVLDLIYGPQGGDISIAEVFQE
jgi:hypothetical protein